MMLGDQVSVEYLWMLVLELGDMRAVHVPGFWVWNEVLNLQP